MVMDWVATSLIDELGDELGADMDEDVVELMTWQWMTWQTRTYCHMADDVAMMTSAHAMY
jgi:hypothetical protein